MLLTIFFFVNLIVLQVASGNAIPDRKSINNSDVIIDYYWQDYTGIIPNNAIPGGIDVAGKITYIGQVYKSYGILPATIYRGSKGARASAGNASFKEEQFVKILCSSNPGSYRWIPTKNEETHLLTDCHLVIGGTEGGFVLNIARVNHEMETIIGKVFANHTPHKGLYIPYKEKEMESKYVWLFTTLSSWTNLFTGSITKES